jgi:hypothetical protein
LYPALVFRDKLPPHIYCTYQTPHCISSLPNPHKHKKKLTTLQQASKLEILNTTLLFCFTNLIKNPDQWQKKH